MESPQPVAVPSDMRPVLLHRTLFSHCRNCLSITLSVHLFRIHISPVCVFSVIYCVADCINRRVV